MPDSSRYRSSFELATVDVYTYLDSQCSNERLRIREEILDGRELAPKLLEQPNLAVTGIAYMLSSPVILDMIDSMPCPHMGVLSECGLCGPRKFE